MLEWHGYESSRLRKILFRPLSLLWRHAALRTYTQASEMQLQSVSRQSSVNQSVD